MGVLWDVGSFDLHDFGHAAAVGLAVLPFSYLMAERFGRFNGGNDPV